MTNWRVIGGSDIAAILGWSPYRGPPEVYHRIVSGVEQVATDAMRRGTAAEPLLLTQWMTERGGGRPMLLQHSLEGEWWRCSVDAFCPPHGDLPARVVEAKLHVWSPEWEAGLPRYVVAQVQWYLHWTGALEADVVEATHRDGWLRFDPLHGRVDVRIRTVRRNERLGAELARRAEEWWRAHVVPRIPPPETPRRETTAALYPRVARPELEEVEGAAEVARRYGAAREAKRAAEAAQEAAAAELQALIADQRGVRGRWGRAVWSETKRGRRLDVRLTEEDG